MHEQPDEHSGAPAAGDPARLPERDDAWPGERETRQRLHEIDDAPLEEHVGVYEDVHRRLQEGLADLDEG